MIKMSPLCLLTCSDTIPVLVVSSGREYLGIGVLAERYLGEVGEQIRP